LSEFRKARTELDASWADHCAESGRNDALIKEATAQAEAAKSNIGVSRAELDLQQRRNEISQRPEFVSSYYRQWEAKRTIQKLRSELQIPLGRLAVRHPEAMAVLEQLGRLSPEPSAHDADIIIGLLEEVLDRSTAEPTGPTGELAVRKSDKGNLGILLATDGKLKRAVTLDVASRFGGVTRRAIEDAARKGWLKTEGRRQQRRVLVDSLLEYFPPEK
jgi:hypothetical protein